MNLTEERIPTWALCYLVNADPTGLSEEDIQIIKDWMEETKIYGVFPEDYEEYYTNYPAFGLPTAVVDCQCAYYE